MTAATAHPLPGGAGVPGLLSRRELAATAETIRAVQLRDGMIPWFEGGHCDPWNHVEAVMALSVVGDWEAAELAYQWLASVQHEDGGWHAYYTAGGVEDRRRDTNVCAYVATGVWHHYVVTRDGGFLETMWPVVEKAVNFVLSWQKPGGEILWNVDEAGGEADYALLTGSSSIYFSVRCAVAVAEALGYERPDWELAAGRIRHAITWGEGSFEPKDRFAMDWYYPVLCGATRGAAGHARLDARWRDFVMDGRGVRCVSDRPWVTTAETAECAIACAVLGRRSDALSLLRGIASQRGADGSYSTGVVYPQIDTFPTGERSTYSAAAVVLAVDVLAGTSPASGLFLGLDLPAGLDLDEIGEQMGGAQDGGVGETTGFGVAGFGAAGTEPVEDPA